MNIPSIVCMDCNEPLAVSSYPNRDSDATCPVCKVKWECSAILPARPQPDLTPKAKVGDAVASCFNHADNEAEAECSCGKLLCKLCTFSQYGKPCCVNCLLSEKQNPDLKKVRLLRYDWMANYAMGLTFITGGLAAPLAIYFLIKHLVIGEEPIYGGKMTVTIQLFVRLGIVLLLGGFGIFGAVLYLMHRFSPNE